MQTSAPPPPRIRCRQIADTDVDDIVNLLASGFRRRKRQYWVRALERLAAHATPTGLPKYGYLLEDRGVTVGAMLLISSNIGVGSGATVRCNLSSWYVAPAYRSHASLLFGRALKHKNVTYLNVSAATHVLPIVEAFGFSRYSNGAFVTLPLLARSRASAAVRVAGASGCPTEPFVSDLLTQHARYGCISLWCMTANRNYPFVFLPRLVKGVIRCAQLIYCRDVQDFVRLARPLGWFLALRSMPLVLIDANGPIPGLVGKYFVGATPRHFKGSTPPRLGDLAFTEAALFGP